MKLNEYQDEAKKTDELAIQGRATVNGLDYSINELRLAFGLDGEAGEIAENYKKNLRRSDEYHDINEMAAELGDILWYVALLADELNLTLEEVARHNLGKLGDRAHRGVLAGSGDDR